MGLEQLKLKDFPFKEFSGGWYPLRERSEIPDNGSPNCPHTIWHQAALRKFPGCSKINSAQVDSGADGNGIYHASFGATNRMIGVFGTGFYENVNGTWTDRTGGMAITDGYPWQFRTFEEGTNKYVIMKNGHDLPLKWTGAGANAALLGGAPSAEALSGDYWHSYYWMTDTTNDTWVVQSGDTAPESWALTEDYWPFPRKVFGVQNNGPRLAVVMEDLMGYIEGFGDESFNREVDALPVGSKATRTMARAQYTIMTDNGPYTMTGFFMVGPSGLYFINENFQKYEPAPQLNEWWNDTSGVNKQYYHRSWGCYHWDYHWYVFAVPVGSAQQPNYLMVLNSKTGAIFYAPDPLSTSYKIRGLAILRDASYDDRICIQDDNGYAYQFDLDTLNYDGSAIEAEWGSKIFDLGATYEMREPQMEASADGDYNTDLYIKFDLESGDGSYDTFNALDSSDVLSTTFTLGASTLGGKEFKFDDLDIAGFGKYIQFRFKNFDASSKFNIHELILWMLFIRKGSLK